VFLGLVGRKQCVQSNSVFDFLQEIVSKVPDIATDNGEEKNGGRRRYALPLTVQFIFCFVTSQSIETFAFG
jgi:hypothetical protein